jgi:hypothetical protein
MLAGEHQSALVLVVSDVWVDIPAVADNFNFLLSQFDRAPANPLIVACAFTAQPMSFAQCQEFHRLFTNSRR